MELARYSLFERIPYKLTCTMTLLTNEEKELLSKATNLMQELLETLEVMHDKELVKDMRASLREAKQCKTMTLEKLVRDLHLDTKVLCGKTAHGEFQGVYSYRVGKYRILYRIEEERILILAVGHRKSMYK